MSTVPEPFLPEHFINRELSWLEFNARVLEEAEDAGNPLLERVKFLAIFASNLDEFFMVRVAGLREQAFDEMLPHDPPADGLAPLAQLQRIAQRTKQLVAQQYKCWNESIVPALAAAGIRIHAVTDLDAAREELLARGGSEVGVFGTDEWGGQQYRTFFVREHSDGYCYCFCQPV